MYLKSVVIGIVQQSVNKQWRLLEHRNEEEASSEISELDYGNRSVSTEPLSNHVFKNSILSSVSVDDNKSGFESQISWNFKKR